MTDPKQLVAEAQCGKATAADHRRRRYIEFKSRLRLFFHAVFWRSLHFFGLARIYSKTMCRLNLYREFPDGRCMWCGVPHE